MSEFGAESAFHRTLPFSESLVLRKLLACLKKILNPAEAEVLPVEEVRSKEQEQGYKKSIIDTSESGSNYQGVRLSCICCLKKRKDDK